MRAHSVQDDNIFKASGQATWKRVDVQAGGVWYQLIAQRGYNFVDSIKRSRRVDTPIDTATIAVRREIFKLSLAPDVATSLLNLLGGGTQLLMPNVGLRIYEQIQSAGRQPDPNAWHLVFDGEIDEPDSGQDPMQLSCSDLSMRLQRAFIRTELAYGVWQANRTLRANMVVMESSDNVDAPSGPFWKVTTPGTTGATEPSWPANPTPGVTTVNDNGVVWTCSAASGAAPASTGTGTLLQDMMQQILDDNMGAGAWTLYVPTAPAPEFALRPYIQSGQSVLEALQALANQIGWLVRYKWDDGTGAFRLTFFDPGRADASVYTVKPNKYDPIEQWKRNLDQVRNIVDIRYPSEEVLDASGNPTMQSYTAIDAASRAAYGDLPMGVAEAGASQIRTAAQAATMGNAILSDISTPLLDAKVVIDPAWWFELNDVITVKADGIHSSADQNLAIYQIDDDYEPGTGRSTTTMYMRGKPCSGVEMWLEHQAAPGLNGGPTMTTPVPAPPANISVTPTIRGARINWTIPAARMKRYDRTEVHIGASPTFTPDSTSLVHTVKGGAHTVGHLQPGETYYVKLRHLDLRGNPGPASSAVQFKAGYTQLPHIDPALIQNFSVRVALSTLPTNNWFQWDTVDYDTLASMTGTGILDSTSWDWTYQYDGKVTITACAIIAGAQAGDSARLKVQKWNGAAWVDWVIGKTHPLVTQASAGSPPSFNDVFEVEFNRTFPVNAGDKFRMNWDFYAATIPSPAWVLNPGGTANFSASYIRCQQELA